MRKLRNYSMENASKVADEAATAVETLLWRQPKTLGVRNVENDSLYRTKDIDILWKIKLGAGTTKTVAIEVKGDRWYKTGNYFFETISNEGKNTPGCFMYTEADFIYYYFVEERELHILPMPQTRNWFNQHKEEFREKRTSTPIGNRVDYVTVGRLIPRERVIKEVEGVKVIHLPPGKEAGEKR
jgi:hypothetical protein